MPVENENYTVVNIKGKLGNNWFIFISNNDSDKRSVHNVEINNKVFSWIGPVVVQKI